MLLSPEITLVVGAFVVGLAGAMPRHHIRPGVFGPAGVDEHGVGTGGSPGTWEALVVSMRLIPEGGTGRRPLALG